MSFIGVPIAQIICRIKTETERREALWWNEEWVNLLNAAKYDQQQKLNSHTDRYTTKKCTQPQFITTISSHLKKVLLKP
jgi:hypothetical protein